MRGIELEAPGFFFIQSPSYILDESLRVFMNSI